MSLADDVTGILPFLREQAESLMLDSCRIERPGALATDPNTGVVSPTHTLVYEGSCKVQATISQSSSPEAGERQYTVQDYRVDIPVGAGPLEIDDRVTITDSQLDPMLVGQVFRVIELFNKSFATAQRCRVEVVTG